jgi:uncharacterized membrane protein
VKNHQSKDIHAFEAKPLTRQEYIAALVHLYRGEMSRANTWRTRLDTTTNWAIITVMGLLSFAFGNSQHSHATLLVGMVMLINFLILESRRYLFFDVWRKRVRMIEENFFNPILCRELDSPEGGWGHLVAEDLLQPRFKISYLQACRARLLRNYLGLFALLLAAWVVKVSLNPYNLAEHPEAWRINLALGPIPWFVVLTFVVLVYLVLFLILTVVPRAQADQSTAWLSHDDQVIAPLD